MWRLLFPGSESGYAGRESVVERVGRGEVCRDERDALNYPGVTADPGQVTLFTGSLSSSAFARQVKLVFWIGTGKRGCIILKYGSGYEKWKQHQGVFYNWSG